MFRKKSSTPKSSATEYPAGVFLHTEKGFFYVFGPGRRYRFLTKRVLDSWAPQRVIECAESDAAVVKLKIISKMKFRNGSLLRSTIDGKIYLVSEGKLRHITNPDIFGQLAMDPYQAVWVSKDELNLHEMGPELN